MPVALIGVAIAAAAAAGSAAAKQDAARKAANLQKDAVDALDGTDLEAAKTLVADQDRAYYIQSREFAREQDPDLMAARDAGAAKIRESLESPYTADQVLAQQISENLQPNAQATRIRAELLSRAEQDLALGATLPPEYQAELVRAGLEGSAQSGVGANRLGPVTARTGMLLGAAGLNLKAQREESASRLLSAETALQQSRVGILGTLLSDAAKTAAGKAELGNFGVGVGDGAVPSVGLRGSDLLQLQLANEELERSKTMTKAQLEAQKAISQGAAVASYIGAAGQLGQGAASALGGAGAGNSANSSFANQPGSQQSQMMSSFGR